MLTAVTTFNAAGVPLLDIFTSPVPVELRAEDFTDALPGALAFFFALGVWASGSVAGRC